MILCGATVTTSLRVLKTKRVFVTMFPPNVVVLADMTGYGVGEEAVQSSGLVTKTCRRTLTKTRRGMPLCTGFGCVFSSSKLALKCKQQ